jgi:hypothetical protein
MKKPLFAILIFFLPHHLMAQSFLSRHNYRSELFLAGRIEKDHYYFLLYSIGYEFSFNKDKTYVSLTNEFMSPLSIYYNIGNSLMSTVNINIQKQNITSFGVGIKENFKIKQNNFVATAIYRQDLFKHKLTFSTNVLFEIYKTVKPPFGTSAICLANCPKYAYIWRFGIAVGKYF